MPNDDPYSRLYHRFKDEFPQVYDNDRTFAAWARLLMIADAAWPTRPPVPASVYRKSLSVLQDTGLVLVERGHYTMLGLDKQRGERSAAARVAADARWNADRIPPSTASRTAEAMPSKAKQSKAEQRQAESSKANGREEPDLASDWWNLTGRYPTDRLLKWLDEIANEFGEEAATKAMVAEHQRDPATQTLVSRTRDRLRADKRDREKAGELREQERAAEFAKSRAITPEDAAEQKARLVAMLPAKFTGGRTE